MSAPSCPYKGTQWATERRCWHEGLDAGAKELPDQRVEFIRRAAIAFHAAALTSNSERQLVSYAINDAVELWDALQEKGY